MSAPEFRKHTFAGSRLLLAVGWAILTFAPVRAHAQAKPREQDKIKKDCFANIRSLRGTKAAPSRFDVAFDRVNLYHASFSCGLYIYASQARDVLESLRYGILYHNRMRFDRAVQYPLTVILGKEADGSIHRHRVIVRDYAQWLPLEKTLSKAQIRTVARAWLGNVMIVGTTGFHPGFIIGNGLAYFSTVNPEAVRVGMIDLSP